MIVVRPQPIRPQPVRVQSPILGDKSPNSENTTNNGKSTVTDTTADQSSLEDSSNETRRKTPTRFRNDHAEIYRGDSVHYRPGNPEPPFANTTAPTNVLVPKFIRVSAVGPKIIRPKPSKVVMATTRMTAIDSQVDFPVTSNPAILNQGARPQHLQVQYPPATNLNGSRTHLPRRSPATSNASSKSKNNKAPSLGGSIESGSSASVHPTPLFQRLVSEEVQELKAYAKIIEQQNRRLAELERVHRDLESRLEMQSDGRLELERTLQEREISWAGQISQLEKDRDQWKAIVQMERNKNAKLMDQIARKDQDIHRMLQRKVCL